MSIIFHITSSQGRADTFYLHATSKSKILTFLNSVSTAIVRNIKEVVYSKTYNINYVSKPPFVPSAVFHKVIIFAYSASYSQQFTLYNVKTSVTQEFLETEYKKMYINDEPITGFFDISFYNEVSKDENIDRLFQVQYKRDSKTYTEDFYSDSYEKVKDFFDAVIDGELIEIRKYVHLDTTVKKDDGDYVKRVNFYFSLDGGAFSSSIPKVKKDVGPIMFKELIKQNLNYNNKNIDSDIIKLTFK
ncbi:MAG: hypothetical protein PHG81_12930 [Aliarcobacter sp.]|nr:hypothetical protein [Aliarcobacter sp.]